MRVPESKIYVKALIFGFAQAAQFSLTAGNFSHLSQQEIDHLRRCATKTMTMTRAMNQMVSTGFRLRRGEVLMLAIPVAEPEQASARRGLCVIFAVYVSRRRVASAPMMVQMLASLELAAGEACSGGYVNPMMTATAFTQLLQRHNYDPLIASVDKAAEDLSILFTSILRPKARWLTRALNLFHPVRPMGRTANNLSSSPYYLACSLVADRSRRAQRGYLCYYHLLTQSMPRRLKPSAANAHLFLKDGLIVGQAFPRDVESYLKESDSGG